jgi:hypothetical protein
MPKGYRSATYISHHSDQKYKIIRAGERGTAENSIIKEAKRVEGGQ